MTTPSIKISVARGYATEEDETRMKSFARTVSRAAKAGEPAPCCIVCAQPFKITGEPPGTIAAVTVPDIEQPVVTGICQVCTDMADRDIAALISQRLGAPVEVRS